MGSAAKKMIPVIFPIPCASAGLRDLLQDHGFVLYLAIRLRIDSCGFSYVSKANANVSSFYSCTTSSAFVGPGWLIRL